MLRQLMYARILWQCFSSFRSFLYTEHKNQQLASNGSGSLLPLSHLESQVSEPEHGGENGEDAVDEVGGDLDDLEGKSQRVELGLVVHALQPHAARLVEVVEGAGPAVQDQTIGQLLVPLQN